MKLKIAAILLLGSMAGAAHTQTLSGTWTLDPAQTATYQVNIQPPINADGSSVWSTKSTIPVQYNLEQGFGPIQFASYNLGTPAYSALDFQSSTPIPLAQLATLSAVYSFQSGDCYGGSLRWSLILGNGHTIFAYYGNVDTVTDPVLFSNCTSGSSGANNSLNNESGLNLLSSPYQTDPRFEDQDLHPGTYVDWATILAEEPNQQVTDAILVLDGGWHADQVFSVGYPQNVTVGTTAASSTFVPQTSGLTTVCATQPATIQVTKAGPSGNYTIDETPISTVPDQGTSFRINGCKYMYNLAGKTLGAGQYKVDILIGGIPVYQPTPGTLFVLK